MRGFWSMFCWLFFLLLVFWWCGVVFVLLFGVFGGWVGFEFFLCFFRMFKVGLCCCRLIGCKIEVFCFLNVVFKVEVILVVGGFLLLIVGDCFYWGEGVDSVFFGVGVSGGVNVKIFGVKVSLKFVEEWLVWFGNWCVVWLILL